MCDDDVYFGEVRCRTTIRANISCSSCDEYLVGLCTSESCEIGTSVSGRERGFAGAGEEGGCLGDET